MEYTMQDAATSRFCREERIRHALAHHVPAMRMNVEIRTDCGTLYFHYKDARRMADLAKLLLEQQLQRITVTKAKAARQRR